nr:reverse transcriptase domain-containing protein [Tanacetum cinerariifolium]
MIGLGEQDYLMAEIGDFDPHTHKKHILSIVSEKKHKSKTQDIKNSSINRVFLNGDDVPPAGGGDLPVSDLRTMKELCQPTLNGRGGPIAPIAIHATNFGLKNDMIQQVQNSCQFSWTSENFITTFEQMAKMFLEKYFPPSMVTKLRNVITNFRQCPDESLFEARESYKLSIDHCPNHNMLPITQINTFYNGLTLRHRDTINAAVGGTFMKRRPEECYDLIKNMTAHHNDWDTSAQRTQWSESSSSITSSSDSKIIALKAEMAEINKNLMEVLQINQQVKAITPSYETCGGPHSYNDCPATVGQTQNVYPARAYQASPAIVEPLRIELPFLEDQFQKDTPPESSKTNNRTMAELLQAPTEGYEDAIVIPEITANNFELKHGTSSSTPAISFDIAELKAMVKALLLEKKNQSPALTPSTTPAPVKAVEPNCVTCDAAANYNQGNTGFRPQMVANQIRPPSFPPHQNNQNNFNKGNNFNRGGNFNQSNFNPSSFNQGQLNRPQVNQALVYQPSIPQTQRVSQTDFESDVKANDAILMNMQSQGPKTPSPSKQGTKVTKDQVQTLSSQNTAPVQPSVIQSESQALVSEPVVTPEMFKEMSFEISFTDALILMPKFASTLKALIENKEKLSEMARTTMNKHCSAVILNKLPRKLGRPKKFLIPCEFSGMDECLELADLGASINLMPLSVWEGLSLPELAPTCMTLELADRSVSKPIGIAKDVSFKVGVFHFPADFVVVDFEPDPRVPLILWRCFLKTSRALIDVHKGELTLRIGNEAITYNLDQIVRYFANYNQMMANKIDVIESSCKEYSQEVLGFSNVTVSGTPTPQNDPIVSATSPTLTPFGDSDFFLFEEADAFLGLEDDPDSPKINPFYYEPEGDILLLEAILNSKPSPPFPNQEQNLPSFKEEFKAYEA